MDQIDNLARKTVYVAHQQHIEKSAATYGYYQALLDV